MTLVRFASEAVTSGEGGPTWVLGGVFGLLVAVFGVALRILLNAQKRSDDNAQMDRENARKEIERLTNELSECKEQRDEYFLKWVECESRRSKR